MYIGTEGPSINGTDKAPDPPVAIQPPHYASRLTAQKGTFTLHGKSKKAIDEYESPGCWLSKIELDSEKLPEMKAELAATGITEAIVFPELPALCRDLREYWNS
jgi:hypothetical protein